MPTDNKFQTDDQTTTPKTTNSSEQIESTSGVVPISQENDFDLFLDSPTKENVSLDDSISPAPETNPNLEQNNISSAPETTSENALNIENLDIGEVKEEVPVEAIPVQAAKPKSIQDDIQNTINPEETPISSSTSEYSAMESGSTNQELFSSQSDNQETQNNTQSNLVQETPQENVSFGSIDTTVSPEETASIQTNNNENTSSENVGEITTGDLEQIKTGLSTDDAVNQILAEDDESSGEVVDSVEDVTQIIDENTAKEEQISITNPETISQETASPQEEFQPTSMSGNMNLDQMVEKFNNQTPSTKENYQEIKNIDAPKNEAAPIPVNPLNIINNASDTISLGDMQDNTNNPEIISTSKSSKSKFVLRIVLSILILILGAISAYVMFPDLAQDFIGKTNLYQINSQKMEISTGVIVADDLLETSGDIINSTGNMDITNDGIVFDDKTFEMETGFNMLSGVEMIDEVPFEELSYEEKLQQYIKMGWDMGTSGLEIEDIKMVERGNIITKEAAELLSGIQMSGEVDFELLEKYFKKFDYLIEKNNI